MKIEFTGQLFNVALHLLIQRILMKKEKGTVSFYVSEQGDLESCNFYTNINSQKHTSTILHSVKV